MIAKVPCPPPLFCEICVICGLKTESVLHQAPYAQPATNLALISHGL